MQTFFVRIHPARANFLSSIGESERDVMGQHAEYWRGELAKHRLIIAGPVPIEPGTFGVLILRAAGEKEAERMVQQDPSVAAGVTNYEIYPLKVAFYEGTI
jgi:uncharacterized protein YciI